MYTRSSTAIIRQQVETHLFQDWRQNPLRGKHRATLHLSGVATAFWAAAVVPLRTDGRERQEKRALGGVWSGSWVASQLGRSVQLVARSPMGAHRQVPWRLRSPFAANGSPRNWWVVVGVDSHSHIASSAVMECVCHARARTAKLSRRIALFSSPHE